MRHLRRMCLCIPVAVVSLSLMADEQPVWQRAPLNTRAVVVVADMSDFSQRVDRVAEMMGLQQPKVLQRAIESSAIRRGLNQQGALLWLFGPKFEGRTPTAYLLPAHKQSEVIRAVRRIKIAGSQTQNAPARFEVDTVDGYVAVAMNDAASEAWLKVCCDHPGGGHQAFGLLNKYLRQHVFGFAISPQGLTEGLKLTFPFSTGDYVFPSLLDDLVDDFRPARSITAAAGGVRITDNADLITSIASQLSPQADVSQWSKSMLLDRDTLTSSIPAGDHALVFATAVPTAWKTAVTEPLRQRLLQDFRQGPELAKQLDLSSLLGLSLRIRPTVPGEHWTSSIQLQIHCRNAADALDAIGRWLPPFLADKELSPNLELEEHLIAGRRALTVSLKDLNVPTELAMTILDAESLLITGGGLKTLQAEKAAWSQGANFGADSAVHRACELVRPESQMIAVADVHLLAVWLTDVYIEYAELTEFDAGTLKHTIDTYGASFQDAPPLVLANTFEDRLTITELGLHHKLLKSIGEIVKLFAPHLSAEFMQ